MSLKSFVNNKEQWDAFTKELDERISATHKSMEGITEPADLYRGQGYIQALRKLKYLRDVLNG